MKRQTSANRSTGHANSSQVSFTYDNGGRLSRITRPGSYLDFQYNARNWLTSVHTRKTDNSVIYDASYFYQDGTTWDHTGNPLKRVENFGGSDFPTTLRYDKVYRLTEETKRDSSSNVLYSESYSYDAVGNRLTRLKDGTTLLYAYDDNNKLTGITTQGGGPSAGFTYDANGNMTSVTGTLLGAWNSLTYDDVNQLTAVTRPGGSDTYEYNALGHRLRATIAGYVTRYVYAGDRVVEDNSATGTVLAWHTVSGPGYGDHWLHMKRWNTTHLYPAYDATGSAREMVDASGTVSDTYTLDAFGVPLASTGSDPNPYRYDAAWGYLSDGSGLQQLGYRFYWPELGRFLQQDPIGDGMNWYAYVGNNPVTRIDPTGLKIAIIGDPCLYYQAIRYLSQVPKIRSIIADLERSPITYKIVMNDKEDDSYNPWSHVIRWDPYSAMLTTNGGIQSPAMGLGHEMAHADFPEALAAALAAERDPRYRDREEWRVIVRIETPAAIRLGEGARRDHYGTAFPVWGPTIFPSSLGPEWVW